MTPRYNIFGKNPKEREEHRLWLDRELDRRAVAWTRLFRRALRASYLPAIEVYADTGSEPLALDAVAIEPVREALFKLYRDEFFDWAERAYAQAELKSIKTPDDEVIVTWLDRVGIMIEAEAAQKVAGMDSATRRMLAGIIRNANATGLSVADTVAAMRSEMETLSLRRALTIARTELGSVANAATHEGALAAFAQSGVTAVKEWISTPDGKRRKWHAGVQPVGINEDFILQSPKGGVDRMRYPLDMRAPAHQVVNCRCAVSYRVQG